MSKEIIKGIDEYYSRKLKEHGAGHLGVDWNSKESQYTRFRQLCRVIESKKFSILDYGCGYGELINYLSEDESLDFNYYGYDISSDMIETASKQFNHLPNVKFGTVVNSARFDYTVASGIFNVKLDLAENDEWLNYIYSTLRAINQISIKGFAFNALTSFSDKEYMKDYLYYADPGLLLDFCIKEFSRSVALFHDYKLYEFTLIVKK